MATVFPLTTYKLSDRTQVNHDHVTARDVLDDGEMRLRVLGSTTFSTIRCVFNYLSQADSLALEVYLAANRATEFTMVIDAQSPVTTYQGYIWSDPSISVSNGLLYTVAFDFRGKVV